MLAAARRPPLFGTSTMSDPHPSDANPPLKIGVLTVSDRASRGEYADRGGPDHCGADHHNLLGGCRTAVVVADAPHHLERAGFYVPGAGLELVHPLLPFCWWARAGIKVRPRGW